MSSKHNTAAQRSDFIRDLVEEDFRTGKYQKRVVTRFPPEPNGYLHIGHAKSICLNFGLATEYDSHCNLRFDDTNPTTEDPEYVESIERDIRWLGYDWNDGRYFASDYFEQLYDYAIELIDQGKAYVDSSSEDEIKRRRGTVTEPGVDSPHRGRSVEENLDLFRRMRSGEFDDGAHVLRAKIDMSAANMKMRDPLLYRIRHAHHYRRGDDWPIYPMYDFAHCLSDSIEGITHSLCTLEFENNRDIYDWVLANTSVDRPPPQQTEFARLNLSYTVLSKRKLLELVEDGLVEGWDDPRMPTLSGLRRRGYPPAAIRSFCDAIGIAKANSVVDVAQLEHAVRDHLNQTAPRLLAVIEPLRVVITNYPEDEAELLQAPYYPDDIGKEGLRRVPFSREMLIERSDFMEDPPEDYRRMAPGREIRLRYGYVVTCDEAVKDPQSGKIVEVRCSYDPTTRGGSVPDGRKVAGTIHWVSAEHSVAIEVRLYDRLFDSERPDQGKAGTDFKSFLNPESLRVLAEARVEPAISEFGAGSHVQFERLGYFYRDPTQTGSIPVFNRTVGLRDTWTKRRVEALGETSREPPKALEPEEEAAPPGTPRPLSPTERDTATALIEQHGLPEGDAGRLARDDAARGFFEAALQYHASPLSLSSWILNEVRGELYRSAESEPVTLSPEHLASLVALVDSGRISGKIAKEVLPEMLSSGAEPVEIVERRGLEQISDADALVAVIATVLAENTEQVDAYRAGKTSLRGYFVGQVMKATSGRANPEIVQHLLSEHLDS